jgi:hypothetical protein
MNVCLVKIIIFSYKNSFPAIIKKGQNLGKAEFDGTKIV